MPAVAMTNVMPIARTPTTLACVSMLRTLSQVGNVSGLRIAPATNSSTTTMPERVLLELEAAQLREAAGGWWRLGSHWTSSARTGASTGATAWLQQLLLGGGRAVDLGDDLALAHDQDARADADELLELGRDDEHAEAGLGEVGDQPVDLGLGRDVDAARRLVEQQHPAVAQQPAGEHHLLLVAAREQPDDAVGVVGHGVERAQLLADLAPLGAEVEQAAAA